MSGINGRDFELRTSGGEDRDVAHAELHGDVDLANAARFEEAVRKLQATRPLVLDLSRAGYFDSAAFAALDRLLGDGRLAVVMDPSCVMRRAATLLGVRIHDDARSARAALG